MSVVVVAIVIGLSSAAPAAAEPAPEIQNAVVAARGAASCGALRYNPTVEHAADIVNRSTYAYLDHTAENVPADEPHPTAIVADLGVNASQVYSLQGAARNENDAIKGLLLEGRDAIPDCSYTDFGASLLHEEQSGYILAVVILVGT
nr:hypothetical protein [Mycobacterium pinniadriaticum]